MERRAGSSKLVYNKVTRTIDTVRSASSFLDGVVADPEYLADARKIIVSALEVGSDLGSEEARAFLAQFEATVKAT